MTDAVIVSLGLLDLTDERCGRRSNGLYVESRHCRSIRKEGETTVLCASCDLLSTINLANPRQYRPQPTTACEKLVYVEGNLGTYWQGSPCDIPSLNCDHS